MNRIKRSLILLLFSLLIQVSFAQIVLTQTHNDATIGLDRKAWSGLGNTAPLSEGYAHDFILPTRTNPCQKITGISIAINLTNYTLNNICPHFETYYNMFYGCTTYAGGATCLPASNLIGEPNFPPIVNPPVYNFGNPLGSPLNSNIEPDFGENLSIDIIPVSDPGCFAVSNGHISYEYTITVTITITDLSPVTPTFSQIPAICNGDTLSPLPTTSNEGITGSWSPAINNTATTTYTFTPNANQCATTQTMTINVNPIVTPSFSQIPAICNGDNLSLLPTTSNEGITGSWTPAINNTATTTYTFTPNANQCATTQTMTITVNPLASPTFSQVSAICNGDTLSPLPTTSNEGITGSWSPAINNTATTTYTFTPNANQCATTQTMTITVNPLISPTFSQIPAICNGDILPSLPTTSNEGITGSWTPALNNTATTTYTFTPNANQCATTQTMTITVNPLASPTFSQVSAICDGDTLSPLPTTSIEGITGSWSPAINNTATTTYTFTPDPGFCPNTVSMTIEVNALPNASLLNEYILCVDGGGGITIPITIDTGLSTSNYNFAWFIDGVEILGANQEYFAPTQSGAYEVLIENSTTFCQNRLTTIVTSVSEPIFNINITSELFSENQMIEVNTSTIGTFEYKIDNGPWQESPVFRNLSPGEHIVSVINTKGCNEVSDTIFVIGYPRFFTPNGDGFNETWNIIAPMGSNGFLNTAEIFIYNRYGKLLKQIYPYGSGWNGLFNGNPMPSDDYWFVINYIEANTNENKQFTSHFSLKR